ncbi:hypothetical protein BRAS3843_1900022 [Bradyrhizobium sp. STM 3843]|nr:hypothetical protein BRAS3843_1900022 [Bradyrhizobium sp. STM 3843]
MEQEVGGSSPPNCTNEIKHLTQKYGSIASQEIRYGKLWNLFAVRLSRSGSPADDENWEPVVRLWRRVPLQVRKRGTDGCR